MGNLRKLQLKELDIFKEFIRICEENNLKYYIIGGTFLGAVRHQGFIPWDDDIDIALPREDYEKFIKIAKEQAKEEYDVINYKTIQGKRDYYYFYYKFINKNEKVIEKQFEKEGITSNAWIDLMAIDDFPSNKIARFWVEKKMLWYRLCMGLYNIQFVREKNNRGTLEKIAINLGKRIDIGKYINPDKVLNGINKTFKKVNKNNSTESGTIFGSYGMRELVKKEYWGNGAKYKFEDIYVNGPEKAKEYLTHMYGDNFMEIPPENKRATYHVKLIEKE